MTIHGKPFSNPKNINLQYGILRFGKTHSSLPLVGSSDNYLYVNSSNQLVYRAQGASSILGTAGSVANFSLNDAYDDGTELTVDGAAVTFTGTHATNNVVAISGSGSGNLIDITNTGSGADIDGTSSTWSVSATGAAVFTGITGCDTIVAAANLALDATATGTITLGGTSTGTVTITPALELGSTLTIAGGADADALIITAGDILVSDGHLTMVQPDNEASIEVTCAGVSSSFGIKVTADGLTSGAAIYVDSDNEVSFSGDGGYLNLTNNGISVFKVQRYGALTIAGNAEGTDSLTLTKGDLKLSDGALVITAGAFTYTAGDMTMSDGSLAITDADDAATFSVTNNTATSASVVVLAGSGVFTGTTTTSWMTITPSGLTSGTGVYGVFAGMTTGKGVHLVGDATQTTGSVLYVENTGASAALTSGTVATFAHVATAVATAVNKIGAVVSITSDRTVNTGGTTSDDFDCLSIIKATTRTAGTAATAGSALYIEVQTTGTVTETSNGIELVMDSGGTGAGIKLTHAATGGIAMSVISAATTVDDVLIAGSGAKADNKASLQVTNSGATAAGGSVLRVINTGTPAAATSYLVDFDYSGATMTNNPTTIYVNAKDSTNSCLEINTSGASAASKGMISLFNSNTGATGVVIHTQHTSTGSAAANDAVLTIKAEGLDAGDAVTEYARIEVEIQNATAGQEDGRLVLSCAADNATLTQMVAINPRVGGALAELVVGSGAGHTYVTTNGAYNLILDTNQGTTSGSITITDGASGAITLAPNGTGAVVITPSSGASLTSALTITAGDLVMSAGVLTYAVTATVTADVGSVQGGSPITSSVVEVAVCANAGDAVTLPTAAAGRMVIITNHGVAACDVFPAASDAINEAAADSAKSLGVNATFLCVAYDATNWEVVTLAR